MWCQWMWWASHTCGVFALFCGDFIGTSLLHTASSQCNSTTSKAWHLNQQTAQTIKRRFLRLFGPTLTHLHTPPPPSYIKKCTNKGYLLKRRTNIPPFIDFLTEKKCSDLPPICTPCMGRCQLAQYLSKKILTSQESHWPVVTGQNNLRAPIENEGVIRPYNQWLISPE